MGMSVSVVMAAVCTSLLRVSELRTPPPLQPGTLRVTPLGGLGDVGRNSASFEIDGEMVLVDCGVLFPEDRHPGVDLILPALDLLSDRLSDIRALVLTHGHEDHIGAVPYLLKQRADIPVYGSKLTLALVASKLKEHRIRGYRLIEVKEGEQHRVGNFELEFFAVNHSIPDGLAVALRTSAGTVLHTGDFKMDQLPLDGRITDLRGFARLADEGVDLFMPDSTNAETPGFTPLEKDIEPSIARVFDQAERKLIVACFASHVHRVQQVLNLAVKHGRKVAYVGRSMVRNMATARDLGYLHVPANVLIEMKDIDKYRDDEVVIISTGSQGEPLAALSRIANREHPVIELGPGDIVLLASSLIPGNENSVYRVINDLTRLGARVVSKENAKVHVSGHASAGELIYCYNIIQPRNVMPIHGEVRHLVGNGQLAVKTGIDPLAKVIRKRLRKEGIPRLKCVYSEEKPLCPIEGIDTSATENTSIAEENDSSRGKKRIIPASVAFVPAAAGLIIGGEVVLDLLRKVGVLRSNSQEKYNENSI